MACSIHPEAVRIVAVAAAATNMSAHQQKTCSRCLTSFECKAGSIEQCQCQTLVLSEAELDYIHDRYDDCLCAACLQALRQEHRQQTR